MYGKCVIVFVFHLYNLSGVNGCWSSQSLTPNPLHGLPITSDQFTNNYDENTHCLTITASVRHIIVIKIDECQLESGYDYLKFYDGSSRYSPEFDSYCDDTSYSRTLVSSGRNLHIRFNTDSSNNRRFNMDYYQFSDTQLYATNGFYHYITSSGYHSYERNQFSFCWIHGTGQIYLELLDFETEGSTACAYDSLTILDGTGSSQRQLALLCGHHSLQTYISTSHNVMLVFDSDESHEYTGFRLRYQDLPGTYHVELNASTTTQGLLSPGYPDHYPNNVNITWTLHGSDGYGLDVRVTTLGLENCCDYLRIYHGCSTSETLLYDVKTVTDVFIVADIITIQFYTDGSTTGGGFVLLYTMKPVHIELYANTTQQSLTSPGYPTYSMNQNFLFKIPMDITWTLHSSVRYALDVNITLIGLDTCCYTLRLYSGLTRGTILYDVKTDLSFLTQATALFIEFHSVGSNRVKGFQLRYKKRSMDSNSTITSAVFPITLPEYPSTYSSNYHRDWDIEAPAGYIVHLYFLDLDIENCSLCQCDYLEITDGSNVQKVCGNSVNNITSTGRTISLHFETDHDVVGRGFKLNYLFEVPISATSDDNDSGSSNHTLIIIVGAIVGAVVVFTSFVLVTYKCIKMRRSKSRSRGHQRETTRSNDAREQNVFTVAPRTVNVNPVFEDERPPSYTTVMREINRLMIPSEFRRH